MKFGDSISSSVRLDYTACCVARRHNGHHANTAERGAERPLHAQKGALFSSITNLLQDGNHLIHSTRLLLRRSPKHVTTSMAQCSISMRVTQCIQSTILVLSRSTLQLCPRAAQRGKRCTSCTLSRPCNTSRVRSSRQCLVLPLRMPTTQYVSTNLRINWQMIPNMPCLISPMHQAEPAAFDIKHH